MNMTVKQANQQLEQINEDLGLMLKYANEQRGLQAERLGRFENKPDNYNESYLPEDLIKTMKKNTSIRRTLETFSEFNIGHIKKDMNEYLESKEEETKEKLKKRFKETHERIDQLGRNLKIQDYHFQKMFAKEWNQLSKCSIISDMITCKESSITNILITLLSNVTLTLLRLERLLLNLG